MMEEELYDLEYSTPAGFSSDYSSMAPMPEENLQLPHHHHHHQVDYYRSFEPLSVALGDRMLGRPDPMFSGSCSAVSESDGANSVVTAGVQRLGGSSGEAAELSSAINAKIASHPLYPKLLQAYIDCQKVGAPPEIARMLDEIRRESDLLCRMRPGAVSTNCMGPDPELDLFMETYCDILVKYKSDLTRPFDEAITFLNKMETQLNTLANTNDGTAGGSSDDEELSGGEIEVEDRDSSQLRTNNEDHELKGKLLRKYSGYISTLKQEFSKKKKKGKLPREAKQILHDWWNLHYKWPYPTEADKITLAQVTGLDQKQINNWFINQRKRHWKPSENMQFAVMDSLYGPCFIKD